MLTGLAPTGRYLLGVLLPPNGPFEPIEPPRDLTLLANWLSSVCHRWPFASMG